MTRKIGEFIQKFSVEETSGDKVIVPRVLRKKTGPTVRGRMKWDGGSRDTKEKRLARGREAIREVAEKEDQKMDDFLDILPFLPPAVLDRAREEVKKILAQAETEYGQEPEEARAIVEYGIQEGEIDLDYLEKRIATVYISWSRREIEHVLTLKKTNDERSDDRANRERVEEEQKKYQEFKRVTLELQRIKAELAKQKSGELIDLVEQKKSFDRQLEWGKRQRDDLAQEYGKIKGQRNALQVEADITLASLGTEVDLIEANSLSEAITKLLDLRRQLDEKDQQVAQVRADVRRSGRDVSSQEIKETISNRSRDRLQRLQEELRRLTIPDDYNWFKGSRKEKDVLEKDLEKIKGYNHQKFIEGVLQETGIMVEIEEKEEAAKGDIIALEQSMTTDENKVKGYLLGLSYKIRNKLEEIRGQQRGAEGEISSLDSQLTVKNNEISILEGKFIAFGRKNKLEQLNREKEELRIQIQGKKEEKQGLEEQIKNGDILVRRIEKALG